MHTTSHNTFSMQFSHIILSAVQPNELFVSNFFLFLTYMEESGASRLS